MKPAPYGPFPYSPIIQRPRLTWPDGAQLALWVIPNIEFFSLMEKVPAGAGGPGTPVPDIPSWSARDYGNRVGVFRLMEVLDRHGIRATVALNSEVCAHHPQIIERGCKLGWEWMGHCESNTRRLNEAPPGEEKGIIHRRSRRRVVRGRSAGSDRACRKPGIRSISLLRKAASTSVTGPTTPSRMACRSTAARSTVTYMLPAVSAAARLFYNALESLPKFISQKGRSLLIR